MIYIDIYVPAMNESFEFRCDENADLYSVCRDVHDILISKNGEKSGQDPSKYLEFWLCDVKRRCILSHEKSLKEQNIINGSRLIFL